MKGSTPNQDKKVFFSDTSRPPTVLLRMLWELFRWFVNVTASVYCRVEAAAPCAFMTCVGTPLSLLWWLRLDFCITFRPTCYCPTAVLWFQFRKENCRKFLFIKSCQVRPWVGHDDPEGEYRYSSTLSLTSALEGVGGERNVPAALPPPPGEGPGTRSIAGWVSPRAPEPPSGFDPRTVQLVATELSRPILFTNFTVLMLTSLKHDCHLTGV